MLHPPARVLVSAPFSWWRKLWSRGHHLGQTVTNQVGSCLSVLDKCKLCRMQTINSSAFLAEQLLPCLVRTLRCVDANVGYTAGPQIDPVDASTRQWHVDLVRHPRRRMQTWRLHRWSRCPMRSSYPCRQNRTPYHYQWRRKTSTKPRISQDQELWRSYERWTWSSSQLQRQSIVHRQWGNWLMLWPGLPRLYQLCVLAVCYTLVVRHPVRCCMRIRVSASSGVHGAGSWHVLAIGDGGDEMFVGVSIY